MAITSGELTNLTSDASARPKGPKVPKELVDSMVKLGPEKAVNLAATLGKDSPIYEAVRRAFPQALAQGPSEEQFTESKFVPGTPRVDQSTVDSVLGLGQETSGEISGQLDPKSQVFEAIRRIFPNSVQEGQSAPLAQSLNKTPEDLQALLAAQEMPEQAPVAPSPLAAPSNPAFKNPVDTSEPFQTAPSGPVGNPVEQRQNMIRDREAAGGPQANNPLESLARNIQQWGERNVADPIRRHETENYMRQASGEPGPAQGQDFGNNLRKAAAAALATGGSALGGFAVGGPPGAVAGGAGAISGMGVMELLKRLLGGGGGPSGPPQNPYSDEGARKFMRNP